MKTVNIKLNDIIPYKNNAKKHDITQINNVAESIKQFGMVQPLVLDKNNEIVIGHCRYEALKKLGEKEAPCVMADDLTEEQIKKLRNLDNKLNESEWYYDLLKFDIEDLDFSGFEVDWEIPDLDFEETDDDDFGYYGDERERTYNSYNLDEYDESRVSGFYQIPTLKVEKFIPTDLIGFNYAKTSENKQTGIHFFIDDYQFERIWNSPFDYVDILSQYECVLTPDFSLYLDMPMAMKIWNVYRARLVGQILQDRGIKVIPTLTWAEPDTYKFCFDGIGKGGTVATSTVGVMRDKESKKIWVDGMKEAIKQIKPKAILLYGSKIDFDFGNINVKYFNSKSFEKKGD